MDRHFPMSLYTNHSETWTLSSVLSKPSLLYQCEKSFTPCGNGLRRVLDLQKRKWPETLFLLLPPRIFFVLVSGWQRQTMQLRQPLASPRFLLPLNKLRSPDLRQFADTIMKESYQPSPIVAENGGYLRLLPLFSKLSILSSLTCHFHMLL